MRVRQSFRRMVTIDLVQIVHRHFEWILRMGAHGEYQAERGFDRQTQ
jgi:hypothetical protein